MSLINLRNIGVIKIGGVFRDFQIYCYGFDITRWHYHDGAIKKAKLNPDSVIY